MADLTLPSPAAAAADVATPAPFDAFAADVSRLSDAEVAPDAVEDLLQALTRAGVITHAQRFALHAAYLRERPRRVLAHQLLPACPTTPHGCAIGEN